MSFFKTSLVACLIVFSGIGNGFVAAEESTSGRRAWFAATFMIEDEHNPINIQTGSRLEEVTLSQRRVSLPIKIPSSGEINIVRETGKDPVSGKPIYVTIAKAIVPEEVQEALIILTPAPTSKAPVLYLTAIQDLASFKGGDTLYINLTKARIGVKFGDKPIPLKPYSRFIHSTPETDKPYSTPISYHFYNPKDEEWQLISASTIVVNSKRREICMFSVDPKYGQIDYRGISFPVSR